MENRPNTKKIVPSCENSKETEGFTLVEVILVMLVVGIIAGVTGPFIGQVVSGYAELRMFNERERQATLALERFVRDVRFSGEQILEDEGRRIALVHGDEENLDYWMEDESLWISRGDATARVLARHVAPESRFDLQMTSIGNCPFVFMDLRIRMDNGNELSFSGGGVPRRCL